MQIIHRQRPLIYLYHPVNYYGVSKKVDGVQIYGDGLIRVNTAGYTK
jgi:peptide/nickel transport system substrate-binding protein